MSRKKEMSEGSHWEQPRKEERREREGTRVPAGQEAIGREQIEKFGKGRDTLWGSEDMEEESEWRMLRWLQNGHEEEVAASNRRRVDKETGQAEEKEQQRAEQW